MPGNHSIAIEIATHHMKQSLFARYRLPALFALFAVLFVFAFFATSNGTVLAAGAPPPTQVPNFLSCALNGNLATCAAYFGTYVISSIIGVFIALAVWLIQLGLQFDINIFNSPLVQGGFGTCLSIANLGFVLAIIVIAISTIFRSETYGYKKALWRLVVMAILVNFGLVITAPIVHFADGMTNYFVTQAGGAAGGNIGTNISNFTSALTNGFNPQAGSGAPAASASGMCTAAQTAATGVQDPIFSWIVNAVCNSGAAQQNGQSSPGQSFMQTLLSMVFSITLQLVVLLAFLTLAVLLLIRYVFLGLLLVVLPFAWLAWIFPGTKGHFSTWWSQFIKWTFFAPAAMFFVWLALSINNQVYLASVVGAGPTGSNTPVASLAAAIGQIPVLASFAQDIVIMGILIGGLMMASKLTGEAGGFVVAQAKGVSNAVTGYVGKQSKKAGRAAFRKANGTATVQQMRTGQFGQKLKDIPVVGGAAYWATSRGASIVGRAADKHLDNKDLVEAAKKNVPDDVEKIKENLRGNMNMEDNLAHVGKLVEKNSLSEDVMVGRRSIKDFMDDNKNVIKANYGSGKLSGDADKALGGDKDMRTTERALSNLTKGTKEYDATLQKLDAATDAFVAKLEKGDMSKMNVNDVLGKDTEMARALSRSFGKTAPQLISSAMAKMKSPTLKNFDMVFNREIKGMLDARPYMRNIARVNANTVLTQAEKERTIAALKPTDEERRLMAALENFKKAFASNMVSAAPGETPAGPATPPPPGGGGGH
jgi:hypothetical protein